MARARILAPLLVLVAVLLLGRAQPGPLVNMRNQVFDQLQRNWPRPWQDAGVRVIDIDEASLEKGPVALAEKPSSLWSEATSRVRRYAFPAASP